MNCLVLSYKLSKQHENVIPAVPFKSKISKSEDAFKAKEETNNCLKVGLMVRCFTVLDPTALNSRQLFLIGNSRLIYSADKPTVSYQTANVQSSRLAGEQGGAFKQPQRERAASAREYRI